MTTHALATLLEHLKSMFGENLKVSAGASLAEAATAFRELPDQNLRVLLAQVRRAAAPQPVGAGGPELTPPAVSEVVARIRAIRDGGATAEAIDLSGLRTKDQLQDVLRAFNKPVSGAKDALLTRIRQLCVRAASTPPVAAPAPDPAEVERGVQLYRQLEQNRQLSISDVRAGFAPFRELSKPVLEAVSSGVGYSPAGSREDILDRLLTYLEGLKMSQHRADRILTGTSG